MRITDIRTLTIHGPLDHTQGGEEGTFSKVIVRVDTDRGLYGLGECERFMGVEQAIAYIRSLLIGRDPLAVRPLISEVIYGTLPPHTEAQLSVKPESFAPGQFHCTSMSPTATPWGPILWGASGVEIALCDLAGKAFNTPVYNILGGAFRDRVRIYLDRSAPRPAEVDDLSAWKRMAGIAVEQKFSQIKFDLEYLCSGIESDVWNRSITGAQMRKAVERLTAIREAIGWEIELCVDGHMLFNAIDGLRFAQDTAHLKLLWLEDPTPITSVQAMADLRKRCPVALCVGEMFNAEQFQMFIDAGACDILHPDVLFCGGLHECKKIGDYAELHSMPMAMHGNGGALATIAAAHVAAATRNFLGLEYHFIESKWVSQFVRREGAGLFDAGKIRLTDAPGLGVELDTRIVKKYLAPGSRMF
jgi:L-alanine-DL-glutamate epimerase-like enolase superfamily enzyme